MSIEAEAAGIKNEKFIGTKAVALRILKELELEYPSVRLLQAYCRNMEEQLDNLANRGLR